MAIRRVVGAAAVAMAAVEGVAVFYEAAGAVVLVAAFLLGALWLWRRDSRWAIVTLAVLFLLEIVYLWDYDWDVGGDRAMIVVTLAVAGVGLAASLVALLRRGGAAA